MKRPEYVATVTAVYRKAIDEGQVTQAMMDALMTAFNRQGFTDGYYTGSIDEGMLGIREDTADDPQWLQAARQSYETGETGLVDLQFYAYVGVDGSYLTATDPEGRTCRSDGPVPELARNLPLTGQMLAERLAKTGGTPFRCASVRTHVEPGLMISAAAVNAMRRDVVNQFTALRARREEQPLRRSKPLPTYPKPKGLPGLTVQVSSREQLTPNLLNTETAMLYVPLHILAADDKLTTVLVQRGRLAVALPRIAHDGEMPGIVARLRHLRELGVRDALVGNLGLMAAARNADMRLHGDFGLNIFNSGAMELARTLEMTSVTMSFEMTLPQIRDLGKAVSAELIAYGRQPLMISEQCFIRGRTGECCCDLPGTKLTDKTGADFPLMREGESCRSVLLNGKKLNWLDRQDDLAKLGLWAVRLLFTTENSREVDRVLADYLEPEPFDPGACTRGLYLRGVE